jgi:hypothetical protein
MEQQVMLGLRIKSALMPYWILMPAATMISRHLAMSASMIF